MEIAGMAIGVVSLVSIFENALTCFTRLRMAKSFGSDLQLFMVRLEVLHLRLTRWGEAVGLNKSLKENKTPSINLRTSDRPLAKRALEQIQGRFEDDAKVMQDIDMEEDVAASTADLGDKKTLVEGIRAMSIKRHARTSVTTKAKWVIYQKDKLESLIEDLSKFLNDLDHVLPAGSAALMPICDDEASQLLDNEALHQAAIAMLEDVAAKLDEKLAGAIARHKARVSAGARQNSLHNMLTTCKADILRSPDHQQQQPGQQEYQHWQHSAWRPNQPCKLQLILVAEERLGSRWQKFSDLRLIGTRSFAEYR